MAFQSIGQRLGFVSAGDLRRAAVKAALDKAQKKFAVREAELKSNFATREAELESNFATREAELLARIRELEARQKG